MMQRGIARIWMAVLLIAAAAGPLACGGGDGGCLVGAERCQCTQAGLCDDGLTCHDGLCLTGPPGGGAGGAPGQGGAGPAAPPIGATGCKVDANCSQGTCNTATGTCEAARVGAICLYDSECASNACTSAAESGGFFREGYCSAPCDAASVGQPCPGGQGVCAAAPVMGSVRHMCLRPCETAASCRPGDSCTAGAAMGVASTRFCYPRCQLSGCEMGWICDAGTGSCVPWPAATGPAPEVQLRDLGTISVGSAALDQRSVAVDVPAGAVSMIVNAAPVTPAESVFPVRITAPGGRVIYDELDPSKRQYQAFASPTTGTMTLQIPQSPQLDLVAGQYQFLLRSATARTDARLHAVFKLQPAAPAAGSLRIELWFTPQRFQNAQSARTDPRFQRGIFGLSNALAAANIRLASVGYHDLTGPAATALAVIDSYEEVETLVAQAGDTHGPALHVFLIERVAKPGSEALWGLTSACPVVPSLPGLTSSGVVVALAIPDPSQLGLVIAHEVGHGLGLLHTTEREGRGFDPLLDTPECPASADANGDMKVQPTECEGLGSTNLMFWSAAPDYAPLVTSDQGFVMRRHPNVR